MSSSIDRQRYAAQRIELAFNEAYGEPHPNESVELLHSVLAELTVARGNVDWAYCWRSVLLNADLMDDEDWALLDACLKEPDPLEGLRAAMVGLTTARAQKFW